MTCDLDKLFYADNSPIHGQGLFTKCDIKAGHYLGEYDGPTVTENDTYVLWVQVEDGNWIGRDGHNLLRYINHNPRPNAEFQGYELYALTDIPADAELTIDYGAEFHP